MEIIVYRTGACEDCGQSVAAGKRGPMPKVCKACRARRNIKSGQASQKRYRYAGITNLAALACPDCGVIVPIEGGGDKRRGSVHEACRAEHDRARSASKGAKRRARCTETDVDIQFIRDLRAAATACPLCDRGLANHSGRASSKEVDHIMPLAAGGKHLRSNLRILCAKCNRSRPSDGSDL